MALNGLNREAGARPALSRNCNGEQDRIRPLGNSPEKARWSDDPKPGELSVFNIRNDLRCTRGIHIYRLAI